MKDKKAPKIEPPQQTSELENQTWNNLPWHTFEQQVSDIQKHIHRASQQGNKQTVHQQQKRLMASEAARLLAVRRVTQDNQGRDTAGVDGIKSLTAKDRLAMVFSIHPNYWKHQPPKPVRRVWIPKPGKAERRPLGILPMVDRSKQALVKLALEPEWEAKFEPHSYGFRPGRGTRAAIEAILLTIEHQPKFVFHTDIEGAFDHVNQAVVLDKLQTYPELAEAINAWLTVGVLDGKIFSPSEMGIPQGGVLSPLLLNVALHGMEEIVKGGDAKGPGAEAPLLIRYADDFVIVHSNLQVLQQAIRRVTQWLERMGLHLHPQKTHLAHTLTPFQGKVGVDFLSFNIRQFPVGKNGPGKSQGIKTVVLPSQEAIQRHLAAIRQRLHQLHSAPQALAIEELNPLIGGWAGYYKGLVSSAALSKYDDLLWDQLMNWARKRHPGQNNNWLLSRYWQRVGKQGLAFSTPQGVQLRSYSEP